MLHPTIAHWHRHRHRPKGPGGRPRKIPAQQESVALPPNVNTIRYSDAN